VSTQQPSFPPHDGIDGRPAGLPVVQAFINLRDFPFCRTWYSTLGVGCWPFKIQKEVCTSNQKIEIPFSHKLLLNKGSNGTVSNVQRPMSNVQSNT
jgi:hypothetical protein